MSVPFPGMSRPLRWFLGASLGIAVLGLGYRFSLAQQKAARQAQAEAAWEESQAKIHQSLRGLIRSLWRVEAESKFPFSPEQARLLLPLLEQAENVDTLSLEAGHQLMYQVRSILSTPQVRMMQAINMNLAHLLERFGLEAGASGKEPGAALSPDGKLDAEGKPGTEKPGFLETASFEEIRADLIRRLAQKKDYRNREEHS